MFVIVAVAMCGRGSCASLIEDAAEGNRDSIESVVPVGPLEGLSLRRTIELALGNNRTIEKAGLDRETERFDLQVAEDEFVPNLNISSALLYNPVRLDRELNTTRTGAVAAEVEQRIPTGGRVAVVWGTDATDASSSTDGTAYDSRAFASFEQPLLRGGGFSTNLANIRIARLSERSNVQEFRRTLIGTITDVVFAYRSFLRSKLQLEVTESALRQAREQLTVSRALVEAGILPPVEIVQTEADIASQEFNMLTARGAFESARFSLIKILDIDREAELDPIDPITFPTFAMTLDEARSLAHEHRPDYIQSEASLAIAKYELDVAENNRRWDLDFQSRYRLTGNNTRLGSSVDDVFSRDNEDWSVGLVLDIPIGDLTPRQEALRARSRALKAELDLVEVRENAEIEIREGFRAIEISRERVRVAGVARELAERKLEIEKGKLQTGRTTNFAVVTFQNDLIRARLNEIAAQITYLNAITSLDETLGTTLDSWNIRIEELDGRGRPQTYLDSPSSKTAPNP